MKIVRLALVAAFAAFAAPAFAQYTQTATANFTVTAAVLNTCQLQNVTPLSFGNYDTMATAPTDATSTFEFRCNRNTGYAIGINTGSNPSAGVRRMTDGTNFLQYQLFSNSGRTTAWGNTPGTDTVGGTAANNGWTQLTIYGRIPAGQDVPGGSTTGVTYTDQTVTITVNY